jgi:hypothetical protein
VATKKQLNLIQGREFSYNEESALKSARVTNSNYLAANAAPSSNQAAVQQIARKQLGFRRQQIVACESKLKLDPVQTSQQDDLRHVFYHNVATKSNG